MQVTKPSTFGSTMGIRFLHPLVFWLGTLAVVSGVGLHVPMFIDSAEMNYKMAGMPMDSMMMLGMTLIIGGIFAAAYGLLLSSSALKRWRGRWTMRPSRSRTGNCSPYSS